MLEVPYPIYFLIIPIGLRITCYYFHGWYEEKIFRRFFPFLLNFQIKFFSLDSIHNFFLILSIPLIMIHILISIYHTVIDREQWVELNSIKNLYIAIASIFKNNWSVKLTPFNLLEWIDTILLSCYVFSCHVVRYFFGSCAKCYVKISSFRRCALKYHTKFNNYHGLFFWASIASLLVYSISV